MPAEGARGSPAQAQEDPASPRVPPKPHAVQIEGRVGASRLGQGRAFGAVTILNATATGIGAALAVEADAAAWWRWDDDEAPGDVLAQAILETFPEPRARGAIAHCSTILPPMRGLKTSSSAAAALLRAAHDAAGTQVSDAGILRTAVAAARRAGITLTGACDDQAAVTLGGSHLTDNRRDAVLQRLPAEAWHVAIWVPEAAVRKADVARIDTTPILADVRAAEACAARGDLAGAMTRNGAAYTRLYRAAGLPVDDRPARLAMEAGALGAGLSGTGPAVAALFDRPCKLPAVAGGSWTWTRAVPEVRP